MSMARGGMLKRPLNRDALQQILEEIYQPETTWVSSVLSLFKNNRKEAEA